MTTNSDTTLLVQSAECSDQNCVHLANSSINVAPPPLHQPSRTSLEGPVAILWDIENCPVPSDVRPEDVAGNIRMALRVHPVINGAVTMFSAYGDFNAFPRRLREGCQRTGVKLVDVPNGRKDAADKAILVDMFLFALDNRPPSSIMLISGDVDFAPALHILGQRGYTVILVIPSRVGVSAALCNAGRFVWDWPSIARGEGFVPFPKPLMASRGGSADIAGYLMGRHISENADGDEEEAIVYRGISQSCYNMKDLSILSRSVFEDNSTSVTLPHPPTLRSHSLPSGLNEATMDRAASNDQSEMNWGVQPGDVNGLKGQLVKLLELSGGCLPIARVPAEYQKLFARPLCISEYGASKLVNLLKKMSDAVAIEGKGQKKFVYLQNSKVGPGAHATTTPKMDKIAISTQVENVDANAGCGSSLEISDEDRIVVEECSERRAGEKSALGAVAPCQLEDVELGRFKLELQEILVSFSCRIFLSKFEEIYQQKYKKPLNYRTYGVAGSEELLDKVRDVAVLYEEPGSRRKFIIAVSY